MVYGWTIASLGQRLQTVVQIKTSLLDRSHTFAPALRDVQDLNIQQPSGRTQPPWRCNNAAECV